MIETLAQKREKLQRLERAFVGAVSSALNYDSKEWVLNDKGRLHAVSSHFLNGTDEHDNGAITLALAKYQNSQFEPVPLDISKSKLVNTSAGESIYFEYNSDTGSFLVPSKKQIRERSGDVENNKGLADAVENTHFNASLFVSNKLVNFEKVETLHLVFRGTEQGLDSVPFKYGLDAYTDLDKYYRQMEVFEKEIFKHIENNPQIKEFTVTGHSLGGAMAQFFHEKHKDYFEAKGINFYATTFGSPGADIKPWFSTVKDKFREIRESLSFYTKNQAIISDINAENTKHNYQDSKENLFNPQNSLFTRTKAFFSLAVNVVSHATTLISSAFINKVSDRLEYNRVDESQIFKNNDDASSKAEYKQEHYFHKYDPIPMVGSLAYNRNGDTHFLNNHIRQQKGANKFFKKIMGEHTSDAYIHNIVNEIQKVYDSTPELRHELYRLNPAFRDYADGYNTITARKAQYQEIVKAHPEIKDLLAENMFSAAKVTPSSKTMAGTLAEFKHAQDQTMTILTSISNNASSYSRNIEPIFTSKSPLLNGKEAILSTDYSDGILPLPKGHKITPISRVIQDEFKTTFIIDHPSTLAAPPNANFKVEYNVQIKQAPEQLESLDKTKQLLEAISIPAPTFNNTFLTNSIQCVAKCCSNQTKTYLEKISIYSSSGKLESFLFDTSKECNLQPDLNLNQYNVHAVQSFHTEYTGDRLSVSDFIANKLGIGKKAPNVDKVLTKANEIASFGAPLSEIENFSKTLNSFLEKPDVLANIKKVIAAKEHTELAEIQERNTYHVKM